jgi:uncharacterized protein YjbJ (UPF0337 family)
MGMHPLSKERFKSSWPQFKDELRKHWREFTDDDLMEIEGDYDKFVSMTQKRCRDKEESVVRWANDWYSKSEQEEAARNSAFVSRNQM